MIIRQASSKLANNHVTVQKTSDQSKKRYHETSLIEERPHRRETNTKEEKMDPVIKYNAESKIDMKASRSKNCQETKTIERSWREISNHIKIENHLGCRPAKCR